MLFNTCLLLLSYAISGLSFQYTSEALLDQVTELPGLNWKPEFNQFSGYINLPDTEKYIHY